MRSRLISLCYFFLNDTATTEIYTLSLHDALPIYLPQPPLRILGRAVRASAAEIAANPRARSATLDRKSTRLNSSHVAISYAVFCLKKKTAFPSPPILHEGCVASRSRSIVRFSHSA